MSLAGGPCRAALSLVLQQMEFPMVDVPEGTLFVGMADAPQVLRLDRANRHGLVAGATGTGKTVTLQILAQAFSDQGVPVFAADVKGDLSGICVPGTPNEKLMARAAGMKAITDGATHYCASLGLPSFREAVARNYRKEFGVDIEMPMDGGGVLVGDKITIEIDVQFTRQND